MQFIRPFQHFDPIKGKLRKKTPPVVKHYLEIAREILVNRNYDEIEYAISTINYLLHGGRELLVNLDSNNEEDFTNKEIETISIEEAWDQIHSENKHFTPSSLLFDIYCGFDIEIGDQEDFPNASWAEYFAVLALAEIAYFIDGDNHVEHPVFVSSCSAEIGEAIAYANTFLQLETPKSRASRSILSLNASKGGIQSNKPFNDIKGEYVDWFTNEYCPGKDDSEIIFSEAARQFYGLKIEPLIDKDYKHPLAAQKKENALRMLETALREHRRLHGKL